MAALPKDFPRTEIPILHIHKYHGKIPLGIVCPRMKFETVELKVSWLNGEYYLVATPIPSNAEKYAGLQIGMPLHKSDRDTYNHRRIAYSAARRYVPAMMKAMTERYGIHCAKLDGIFPPVER